MKKALRIIGISLAVLACLLMAVIFGFRGYQRVAYRGFYAIAEREWQIPGIADGLIQQGLHAREDKDTFLLCGYMHDGSASRIYEMSKDGRIKKYVTLQKEDGTPDTSHTGGLTVYGDFILVTHSDHIVLYSLSAWNSAKSGDALAPVASFATGIGTAFCTVSGDLLYVGEFYREQNYKTDPAHHRTMPSGAEHHAIVAVYSMSELVASGFTEVNPRVAYSIRDLTQGFAVTADGSFCLGSSYALAPSLLEIHRAPTAEATDAVEILGKEVPLHYLDDRSLLYRYTFFPMCEEIVCTDGRIYILNESASAKYIFGKLTAGGFFYSIPDPTAPVSEDPAA